MRNSEPMDGGNSMDDRKETFRDLERGFQEEWIPWLEDVQFPENFDDEGDD